MTWNAAGQAAECREQNEREKSKSSPNLKVGLPRFSTRGPVREQYFKSLNLVSTRHHTNFRSAAMVQPSPGLSRCRRLRYRLVNDPLLLFLLLRCRRPSETFWRAGNGSRLQLFLRTEMGIERPLRQVMRYLVEETAALHPPSMMSII